MRRDNSDKAANRADLCDSGAHVGRPGALAAERLRGGRLPRALERLFHVPRALAAQTDLEPTAEPRSTVPHKATRNATRITTSN